MSPDPVDYGARLLAVREARGMTQFDVGQIIGKRDNEVSRYERGVLNPKIAYVVLIADSLGVTLDYLCGRSDDLAKALDSKWVDPRAKR